MYFRNQEISSYLYGLVGGGAVPDAQGLLRERYGSLLSYDAQETLSRVQRCVS